MKTLMFATMIAAAALSTAASAETVTIQLDGVRATKGDLYVSLQTRAQFMKPTGTSGKIVRHPSGGSQTVTLTGVAPGDYSVAVWHDIDGNHRFDRAPDGKPLDGWAMVNAETLRSVPTFDQVSFPVGGGDKKLKLEMHYGR